MKNIILPLLVAVSTTVSAQPLGIPKDSCDLPNVSFVCTGYDFAVPVLIRDSVWVDYDTSMENYPEAYPNLEQMRKDGGEQVNFDHYESDSVIEHRDYMQTISLDFDNYTITYYSAEQFAVNNIVGVYEEPLAYEPGVYIIIDQNEDESGFNSYLVDFVRGTIVANDAYLEYLDEVGTLTLNVSQFIKY